MKLFILIVSLSVTFGTDGQNLFKTGNGKVKFFSEAPLENIEAATTKATAALNVSSGEVAVLIPIKSFVFHKSLMQEHFNENYMESDKYPDASFKGKILETILLNPDHKSEVNISGELFIHGVQKHRDIQVTLRVNADGSILATGKFSVQVADHKVKIPSIVFHNIAEIIEVTIELTLKPVMQP